jgi:hypothetical protein
MTLSAAHPSKYGPHTSANFALLSSQATMPVHEITYVVEDRRGSSACIDE